MVVLALPPMASVGQFTTMLSDAPPESFSIHTCSGTLVAVTPAISSVLEIASARDCDVTTPTWREYGLVA
jgi:hypothetical protein